MLHVYLYFLILAISVLVLWFAGDNAVKYSLQTAKMFNLSSLFVGLLLIGVSTGIPELAITFIALFKGVPDLALGDLMGTCIVDIGLALGLAFLIGGTFKLKPKQSQHASFMLLIVFISLGLSFIGGYLEWIYGLVLIFSYGLCVWWMIKVRTPEEKKEAEERKEEAQVKNKKFIVILKLATSIILILVASNFAINYALKISDALHLPSAIVGATIFAIGTSIPEIFLAICSVRRKQYALALGTCIGSVLLVVTFNLGILAFFAKTPLNVKPLISILPYLMITYSLLIFSMHFRKKLGRFEGAILLAVFLIYLAYEIWP